MSDATARSTASLREPVTLTVSVSRLMARRYRAFQLGGDVAASPFGLRALEPVVEAVAAGALRGRGRRRELRGDAADGQAVSGVYDALEHAVLALAQQVEDLLRAVKARLGQHLAQQERASAALDSSRLTVAQSFRL